LLAVGSRIPLEPRMKKSTRMNSVAGGDSSPYTVFLMAIAIKLLLFPS